MTAESLHKIYGSNHVELAWYRDSRSDRGGPVSRPSTGDPRGRGRALPSGSFAVRFRETVRHRKAHRLVLRRVHLERIRTDPVRRIMTSDYLVRDKEDLRLN